MKDGISAVVATLNRRRELKRLFESFRNSAPADLEVIVVDQNTTPLLDDLIEEYKMIFTIIHVKMKDANQSKARNHGASIATRRILCFPDDDCWFEPSSLKDVQNTFSEKPETDLLIIHWNQNPVQNVASGMLSKNMIYSFKAVGYATYVLFFRKEVFIKLGGFIETIGIGKYIGGGEDSEITFRTAKENFNIYYDSGIHVNHNYISIYTRDMPVIRARQRAMGLLYSMYPVGPVIILRGLISPLLKMVTCGRWNEIKKHGNVFVGRMEGMVYGYKIKGQILKSK